MNRNWGDTLRQRLAFIVRSFREALHALGIALSGGLFPIQTLEFPRGVEIEALHRNLEKRGMRTVLRRGRMRGRPCVTLLLTAAHSPGAIQSAVALIGQALGSGRGADDKNQFTTRTDQTEKNSTQTRRKTYERYIGT